MSDIYLNTSLDSEFQLLLPMATREEFAQLEKLLLAEGCRDPLVVTSKGTVVDGMTRWTICKRHKLPFNTVVKDFESRIHARIWIRETQGGRRNSTDAQRIENALELEKDRALLAKTSSAHVRSASQVIENTAVAAGVSKRTVNNFVAADASPVKELGRMMKNSEVSIRAAADVAKLPPKQQERIIVKGPSAVKAAAAAIRKKAPAEPPAPAKDSPFPDSTLIDETLSALAKFKGYVVALLGDIGASRDGDPCGIHLTEHRQDWQQQLDMMRHLLKTCRPYAVCPYCEGKGKKCEGCKSVGWVGKSTYERAPREMKDRVKDTI